MFRRIRIEYATDKCISEDFKRRKSEERRYCAASSRRTLVSKSRDLSMRVSMRVRFDQIRLTNPQSPAMNGVFQDAGAFRGAKKRESRLRGCCRDERRKVSSDESFILSNCVV